MNLKALLFLPLFILVNASALYAAATASHGSGEVTDVDSIAGRVTLKEQGEFSVTDSSLLKNINRRDLVDYALEDDKRDARINKITKTGEAPVEDDGLPIGKAMQDVLNATGETAKFVTSPITPVHDTAGEAVNSVTGGTGEMVSEAKGPRTKQNF